MTISAMPTKHEGKNIKRIREILGIKQDTLASELGLTQQAISQLEQKDVIDSESMQQVARALKVPAEAIKNFSEDLAINVISSNTFNDHSANNLNYQCSFNPIDKVVELYERMLREKDDLIEKLITERGRTY
ncbi:XRE family transcriptional regulator [Deminuibacter soli]|uniref:XRE family transcriptional regulator n=2 Tax=Deminuibacter soli TaxID=2291815 RepID=A0A3E1NJN8_9BACT|nr:XRE family transcriptional regulator [Deminuibacter soli]